MIAEDVRRPNTAAHGLGHISCARVAAVPGNVGLAHHLPAEMPPARVRMPKFIGTFPSYPLLVTSRG